MNLDRNDGNLLVKKKALKGKNKGYEYRLIPIDHSLSIPDNLEVYSYDICWMDWEQSHANFSKSSLDYIKKMDVLRDIKMLDHTFKFRKICLRNIRITGTLLKKGAEAGLTLHQIGTILCRDDDYDDEPEPSLLENICKKAQDMACSIRKIKLTNFSCKLDSVEEFRERKRNRRASLKNKSPDEMVSKAIKQKTNIDIIESPSEVEERSKGSDTKIIQIMDCFAAFESHNDKSKPEVDELTLKVIPEPQLNKFTSFVLPKKFEEFDLSQVGQKVLNHKRDRAQSENDTEFLFECSKATSSPKKFIQRRDRANNLEEEKKDEAPQFTLKVSDNSDEIEEDKSSSSEEESDEVKKSPPIKRTVSLPRIKILENKPDLPKITEVDEEDLENMKQSNDSDNGKEKDSKVSTSDSINIVNKKITPPKIIRQKSSELTELKLKDSPYDEDFFYYFELYLEESIKKIVNASQKLNSGRTRSRSEV